MQKTTEVFTSGIVNIPLTKPAIPFFISENLDCCIVFETLKIPFEIRFNERTEKHRIIATQEQSASVIKEIWHGWHRYRPKFDSKYKYLFWEIDTQDENVLHEVIKIYAELEKELGITIPIYVHRTMQGYHFISLQPIPIAIWAEYINKLRPTNSTYPPITLRIRPNKYVGEENIFKIGFIVSSTYHADTQAFKSMIETQDLEKLRHNYYIVNYRLEKPEGKFEDENEKM